MKPLIEDTKGITNEKRNGAVVARGGSFGQATGQYS